MIQRTRDYTVIGICSRDPGVSRKIQGIWLFLQKTEKLSYNHIYSLIVCMAVGYGQVGQDSTDQLWDN